MTPTQPLLTAIRLTVAVLALAAGTSAKAALLTFAAGTPADNASTRATWMGATGAASEQHMVNFESGFANNQNISGVSGLFGGGLVIRDTSAAGQAIVRSGAGVINQSNPIGSFAVTHNEQAYLELDFSAAPISYFGGYTIDQAGTSVLVDFLDGTSTSFVLATTGVSGNSAEFFGIVSQGGPRIERIRFDASGDGRWGLDNLAFGTVPEPGSLALVALAGLALLRTARRRTAAAEPAAA